jgi:hypothetical protein
MKASRTVNRLLLVLACLAVPNLLAQGRGSLHVTAPEAVAGQPLAPGDYAVLWDESGPNVELRILRGKTLVATATAHETQLQKPSRNDTAIVEITGDRRILSQMYFINQRIALAIQETSGSANSRGKWVG